MIWVIIIAVVLLLVFSVRKDMKKNAAVKAAAQEAGATDGVECKHIAGLGLGEGAECEIWSFTDRLQIRDKETGQTFNLAIGKIRAIEAKTETEIREVGKSVLGRAIVGNLIVPGLGAIVGGMTGVGTTKKKGPEHHYLIVNYVDAHGEVQGITFSKDGYILQLQLFAKGVKELLAQVPREAVTL